MFNRTLSVLVWSLFLIAAVHSHRFSPEGFVVVSTGFIIAHAAHEKLTGSVLFGNNTSNGFGLSHGCGRPDVIGNLVIFAGSQIKFEEIEKTNSLNR